MGLRDLRNVPRMRCVPPEDAPVRTHPWIDVRDPLATTHWQVIRRFVIVAIAVLRSDELIVREEEQLVSVEMTNRCA
jgi:hypothetical protein